MPKISIIMPVYNSVEYLKEAIDSILSQTFMDWEFIIINEFGSNDGSKEIIEQYAKVDNRFILIQNESRLGISESMNMGLQTAKGEYIARMDADDISLPKRFEKQIEYMDKHPEIAMCGVKVEIFGSNPFEWKLETNPDKLATNILFYSPSVHPTIMIRKSFLDKYGIKYNKDYKASEDYDLFSQICQYGKVANINEILFRYRIMQNNATFKNNDIGLIIYNKVMQLQFQRLELSFDEDELNLLSPHLCMKGAKSKDALIRLSQLDLLLKKILVANDKVKLYQIDSLMMTLHKRFKEAFDSISWACSGVDLKKAEELYNKSIFAKDYFYKPNHLNKIKVTPTVSVLLPTYNSQKYIMDTIWSILEQTYDDFELIILNEFGSNDDTVRIAEMFQDSRIRIIQNTEKKGLAESLNIGIKEAKGKYLARIDADDLCDKNRFKLQVQFLDNNLEYGVCGSWQHHFGINTDWIHRCSINHDEIAAELLYNCDLCHSTLMLRKEYFVKNNLFYDNRYAAEDYELWTRAIKKFKFANIPQILGEYRVGEDNITSKKMEQLSKESGELAARNLEHYFGIKVPENHILMLSGWRNEISRLGPKQREIALKQEKKILNKIWEINKSKKEFDNQSLLKTLNKRWRSITNTWQEDKSLVELNDLFKMYNYGAVKNKLIISMSKQNFSAKKIVKKIFSKIFRPIKYRTVDIIQQQLWDMDGHVGDIDGHIYDYKVEILNCIEQRIAKIEQNILQAVENKILIEEDKIMSAINCRIIDREHKVFQNIDRCVSDMGHQLFQSLDKKALDREQGILHKVDNNLSKYEQNILHNINDIYLKYEDDILKNIDARIWKGEQNILQVMDARVWKAECNLSERIDFRQSENIYYNDVQKSLEKKEGKNDLWDYLLLNDTFDTFHHGCSATSIAIKMQLMKISKGKNVESVSWRDIHAPELYPKKVGEYVSDEFFEKWKDKNRLIYLKILNSNHIIINGEGSLSHYDAGTLILLYLAYISKVRFGKHVSIINHSLYYREYNKAEDHEDYDEYKNIIRLVYEAIDNAVLREKKSYLQLKHLVPDKGILGFDCLPLYIKNHYIQQDIHISNYILISGGNNLGEWYAEYIYMVHDYLQKYFGKKLKIYFLFSDIPYSNESFDLGIYEKVVGKLSKNEAMIYKVQTTDEWLSVIEKAVLFISGRFHHTIASFMLNTPFLVFEADTKKVESMLYEINKEECLINQNEVINNLSQTRKIIESNHFFDDSNENIKSNIIEQSKINFSLLRE